QDRVLYGPCEALRFVAPRVHVDSIEQGTEIGQRVAGVRFLRLGDQIVFRLLARADIERLDAARARRAKRIEMNRDEDVAALSITGRRSFPARARLLCRE